MDLNLTDRERKALRFALEDAARSADVCSDPLYEDFEIEDGEELDTWELFGRLLNKLKDAGIIEPASELEARWQDLYK